MNTTLGVTVEKPENHHTEALVVGFYEGEKSLEEPVKSLDQVLQGALLELLQSGDFKGKAGETALWYPRGAIPSHRMVLVGLGKQQELTPEALRRAGGTASEVLLELGCRCSSWLLPDLLSGEIGPGLAARALMEGALLGAYRFTEYKTANEDQKSNLEQLTLLTTEERRVVCESALPVARAVAEGVYLARDLVNRPGNQLTPSVLAEEAQRLADQVGLTCRVLGPEQLRQDGMGALLAVAQGSTQPPRFVILEYPGNNLDAPPLVFVGKGLTFDSGGISIKPSSGMEEMKTDMAGAAAVLGALQAVAQLNIAQRVVGLIPATENMPGGTALKPGDIIKGLSGLTIEVVNTDAEGRLVLSDALSYATRYKPAAVIDLATLTGACVIALGKVAMGLFGNDQSLIERVKKAAEAVHERVWPMPLWSDYDEQIKSEVADVKNSGGRPAGAITAAAFLKKFATAYPWGHLDIAGTAFTDKASPYTGKGATGAGVRLLVQLAQDWGK